MNLPTTAVTLGDDTTVTVGLLVLIVTLALALGQGLWQISHLREWKREAETKIAAVENRCGLLEVRQGRTDERLDNIQVLLAELRGMVQRLLERNVA